MKKYTQFMLLVALVMMSFASTNAQEAVFNNPLIHVSLDENCQAVIGPDMVLEGDNAHGLDYTVTINGGDSNVADQSMVGLTIEYVVTSNVDGGKGWGELLIEDKVDPIIYCPDPATFKCTDLEAFLDGSFDAPKATAEDACGNVSLSHSDEVQDGGACYNTVVTRTFIATDDSGNTAECEVEFTFRPLNFYDLHFPEDDEIDCSEHEDDLDDYGKLKTGEVYGAGCNIDVTHKDHIVEICEGSYKVLRTWKAIDWCKESPYNVKEVSQLIKVLDTTGPTVEPIAAITLTTNLDACEANTILPTPVITDDCSPNGITFEYSTTDGIISYDEDLGVHFISGLGLGESTVTILATDGCGNVTPSVFKIIVKDLIAPIAICDEHTVASLGSNGTVSIPAHTFDDGSYDNCEIVEYKVRRMTDACNYPPELGFGDYANFCCEDLGTTVMVEFRVKDAAGNINSCMVEVQVQDKIKPIIVCPADKTIDCTEDFEDTDLTGVAIALDNCSDVTPTFYDYEDVDNCGNGIIDRYWSVTDDAGNTASCYQRITVENSSPFFICDFKDRTTDSYSIEDGGCHKGHTDEDGVEWPADLELNSCGNGLLPSDLDADYPLDARPQIFEGYCDQIAVGYDDLYLPIQDPACVKILRTWIVIDWCVYDVNNGYPINKKFMGPHLPDGRWEYTQVIKVLNSEAPEIYPGGDSYVGNFEENCGEAYVELFANVTDDCTPVDDIVVTYSIAIKDGPVVSTGSGKNASRTFANGEYVITWTATDGCGNYYDVDFPIKVEDKKKPTPVCYNGLATVIMPSSGDITIWAIDFEASSFDNCSSHDELRFSFSSDVTETSRTFSCADISPSGSATPVEIWVTDSYGNQDFCLTYILLQDPNGACPPTQAGTVTPQGAITTEAGLEVEDVTINLLGSSADAVVTDANGTFAFPTMAVGNYDVQPVKDLNPDNGVTTFDLVIISKHILGTDALDSPYKMIAADANASGTITTFDIVNLRRLILQIDSELANNTSWRFVDASYEFTTDEPQAEAFPEVISLTNNASDFVGVKIGDVNGSASPNNLLGTDTRNFDGNLEFNLDNKAVAAGETFTVDFKAKDFNNMLGYQFALSFEGAEFVDVATSLEQLDANNFGLTLLEEGIITTSWNTANPVEMNDDAVLFTLTFQATAAAQLSEVLSLSSRYTAAEAYNDNADLYNVALNFNGTTVEAGGFELYQNTPNPFRAQTTIGFNLPEAGAVSLKIYDVSGRVLKAVNGDFAKGYNEVRVNRSDLSGSGVLYYQLDTQNDSQTKKMILVD